jgi:hypothetical protein
VCAEKSRIEALILDPENDYLQPYFYNNPLALRCELGRGAAPEEYLTEARRRAEAIRALLLPRGADAMIFNYWMYDWSDSGEAEENVFSGAEAAMEARIGEETRALRFLLESMLRYRHVSIRGLGSYLDEDDPDRDSVRRDRIVCYSDGRGFDDAALIEAQIASENSLEVGLVSFENECILSVYDDRGCDIVFAAPEKLVEFYEKLRPFFLDFDLEEMEKRYRAALNEISRPS